jgi:hypothetical protein
MFTPGYLSAIAFSPLDPDKAYGCTSNGALYYSDDGAVTWRASDDPGPGGMAYYGSAILPSSTDKDVCWVGGSGYGNAPVFRTEDGGANWTAESNGLPSTLVYCLADAPDQSGRIFCGSENGAWVYDPDTRTWSDLLGSSAPITTYWCCEAVPGRNLIRFGTYARGIWDYHLNSPGFFPYGELKGGSNVLSLKAAAPPAVGKVSQFQVKGCAPNVTGMLAWSLHPDEVSLYGGTVLVNPKRWKLIPFKSDGAGNAAPRFQFPGDPEWVGTEVYFQALARDPAMAGDRMALSHGLRAVVGH